MRDAAKERRSSEKARAGRIEEILISRGRLTQEQLQAALRLENKDHGRLGEVLLSQNLVSGEDLAQAVAEATGFEYVSLSEDSVDPAAIPLLDEKVLRTHVALPLKVEDGRLVLAMSDPTDILALDDLKTLAGYPIRPLVAAEEIDGAIQTCGLVTARGGQSGGKATLVATVRRGFGAAHRGAIILSAAGEHWEISNIDATAMGSDLRPLRVATRFCADLTGGALDDAYTLFSSHFQAQITRAQLSDDLRPDAGASWTVCAPVLRSYQVNDDKAAVDVSLTATFGDGAKNVARARLVFIRVDGSWSLDGVRF